MMQARSFAVRSALRRLPCTAPQVAALDTGRHPWLLANAHPPPPWRCARGFAAAPNPDYVPPGYEKKSEEAAPASPAAEEPPAAPAEVPKVEAAPEVEAASAEVPKAEASASEPATEPSNSPQQEEAGSKAEKEAKTGEEPASDPPKPAPPKPAQEPDSKWKAIFKGVFFGCLMGGGYTAMHVGLLGKSHLFEGLVMGTLLVGPAVAGILADQYRSKVVFPYLIFTGICWALFLYETDSSVWWIDRPQKWDKMKSKDLAELDDVVKKWNAGDLLADHNALDRKFQLLKDPVSGVITPESLFMYFKYNTSEARESALLIETVLVSLMDSGDHSMSFVEFAKTVVLLYAMAEGNDEARVTACFKVLDSNNNGSISEDELVKWARFLRKNDLLDEEGLKNWGENSPEEVAKKYMEMYDQDRDGKISYAEFTRLGPMIHFGKWMKEKGLAQWLITVNTKKDDRIGKKTRVHVSNI